MTPGCWLCFCRGEDFTGAAGNDPEAPAADQGTGEEGGDLTVPGHH